MDQRFSTHNRRVESAWAAVQEFVTTLYAPDDVVYVLAVESWQASGRKTNRVVGQFWFTSNSLIEAYDRLRDLNQAGANIYVGVNPRTEHGSPQVKTVRCLWADIDGELPNAVLSRLPPVLPKPSMVIGSGTGTHLYWMLSETIEVTSESGRSSIEGMLKRLYAGIGGDCVQNVTRLLRLPGFENRKDARNGRAPVPCMLVQRVRSTYPLSEFASFFPDDNANAPSGPVTLVLDSVPEKSFRTLQRIRGLIRYLDDREAEPDRSSRDWGCVMGLFRLGCSPTEIASLLSGHGKFANEAYLNRTIEKAFERFANDKVSNGE